MYEDTGYTILRAVFFFTFGGGQQGPELADVNAQGRPGWLCEKGFIEFKPYNRTVEHFNARTLNHVDLKRFILVHIIITTVMVHEDSLRVPLAVMLTTLTVAKLYFEFIFTASWTEGRKEDN